MSKTPSPVGTIVCLKLIASMLISVSSANAKCSDAFSDGQPSSASLSALSSSSRSVFVSLAAFASVPSAVAPVSLAATPAARLPDEDSLDLPILHSSLHRHPIKVTSPLLVHLCTTHNRNTHNLMLAEKDP